MTREKTLEVISFISFLFSHCRSTNTAPFILHWCSSQHFLPVEFWYFFTFLFTLLVHDCPFWTQKLEWILKRNIKQIIENFPHGHITWNKILAMNYKNFHGPLHVTSVSTLPSLSLLLSHTLDTLISTPHIEYRKVASPWGLVMDPPS